MVNDGTTDVSTPRLSPPLPSSPPSELRSGMMKTVLGAPVEMDDGYVREILALIAAIFVHAILILLLVGYLWGRGLDLKDFVLGWGVAVYTLDISCITYYFGKKSGQGT